MIRLPAHLESVLRRIELIDAVPALPAWQPDTVRSDRASFQESLAHFGEPPARTAFDPFISASAKRWGVETALVKAIVANESGFDPRATSPTGAQGLMQLEPDTAAGLGVTDPYDAAQNLNGGTRYIRGLLDRFHGDLTLALAAYNAGPLAVEKYGGVPPYAETRAYVRNVLAAYRSFKEQR